MESTTRALRERVGDDQVICALSGAVDSSVVAVLLHDAIGRRLHCIFVNDGLLRRGEAEVLSLTRQAPDPGSAALPSSRAFLTPEPANVMVSPDE